MGNVFVPTVVPEIYLQFLKFFIEIVKNKYEILSLILFIKEKILKMLDTSLKHLTCNYCFFGFCLLHCKR